MWLLIVCWLCWLVFVSHGYRCLTETWRETPEFRSPRSTSGVTSGHLQESPSGQNIRFLQTSLFEGNWSKFKWIKGVPAHAAQQWYPNRYWRPQLPLHLCCARWMYTLMAPVLINGIIMVIWQHINGQQTRQTGQTNNGKTCRVFLVCLNVLAFGCFESQRLYSFFFGKQKQRDTDKKVVLQLSYFWVTRKLTEGEHRCGESWKIRNQRSLKASLL